VATSSTRTCYGVEFTGGNLFAVRAPDGAIGYLDPATGSFKPIVSSIAGLTARAGAAQPASWASGFGALWVLSGARLVEADLRTGRVLRRIAVGSGGGMLAIDSSGVWLVDGSARMLFRIDPVTGRVVSRTRLRYRACCIVSGFGRLW